MRSLRAVLVAGSLALVSGALTSGAAHAFDLGRWSINLGGEDGFTDERLVSMLPTGDFGRRDSVTVGRYQINNWVFGFGTAANRLEGSSRATLSLGYGTQLGSSVALSFGPTFGVGLEDQAALDLTPPQPWWAEARRDGPEYGLQGSAVWSLTDSWALTGVLGYRRQVEPAGNANTDPVSQFFSVFGLGYRF